MNASSRLFVVICLLFSIIVSTAHAQRWSRGFGAMGLDGASGFDGEAYCFGEYQGKLVVGGWFEEAGDVAASHLAIWDGESWEALAGGVNQIPAFVVGTPYSLYVGGPFWEVDGEAWTYCARWDGTWHEMPGLEQAPLCGVMVNGQLWIGGSFTREEIPPWWIGMKRWSISGWVDPENFGSWDLYRDEARAIGDGYEVIHLGGAIERDVAGGITYNHVAWHPDDGPVNFGGGVTGGHVECFQPDGSFMWVGGNFTHADGQESRGLVELSSGGTYFPVASPSAVRYVEDMTMHQGGLHLVLDEGVADQVWVVRRYGSGNWSDPLGGQFTDGLNAIESIDGDLYVGGFFANGVVRWDDEEWVHLGGGIGLTHHDRHWFKALVEFEGDVVAAGENVKLPAVLVDQYDCESVVRWDGDAWHRLDRGLGPDVSSLAVYDGVLYAGLPSGEGSLQRLQRWDGEQWQDAADADNQIHCLAVHGDELVAGGYFTTVDGVAAGRVAAFDGAAWRALGAGMDGAVRVLFENDGVLYAGGSFTEADGEAATRIARWTGTAWEAMGAGFEDGHVYAITAYGGEIFAGGSFTASGGSPLGHVARWDGAQWQPLGEGVAGDISYGVAALRGTTDGLYVGGDFTEAGGAPAAGLARWDGAWSEFMGGVSEPYFSRATVSALLVHEGDLWVAGHFTRVGDDIPSYCIAQWQDGTLVPTLLSSFSAEPRTDGTVVLSWQVSPSLADADFRLTATAEGAAWEVAYAAGGAARFTAHDTAFGLAGATAVCYRLAHERDGRWADLGETTVQLTPPAVVRLRAAAPNPFNPATQITFELDCAADARLEVYDLAGRRLATLAAGRYQAGRHGVTWRGCDGSGRSLPSGTYLVRLVTDSAVRSQKVMLAR